LKAAAAEWARRQQPPGNRRLLGQRLPERRPPERRPLERRLLEQGLLERRLEFRARVRQSYRPTRCGHRRRRRSGAGPIRGFRWSNVWSNVLRDVPYLTFFSVPLRLESEI